ncbi:Ras-related protein Rab-24 [Hondaea fermentalgiana]|uniref:Ras-related protein Rab-24 n=1 Tax=Hondaea fermentalgiana TaxID=2315210 RepID=A0A2R5GPJ1_9STRA|nr:Ras-related protein Rab-24 [Hondaea fermentalgiana]|eukprot:GBG32796.1 Ras-related protein Rab-24 [Hondaea fermentalgiana]
MREVSVVVCGSAKSGKSAVARELVRTPRLARVGSSSTGEVGLVRDHAATSGWLTAELFQGDLLQGRSKLARTEVHLDVWDLAALDCISDELATTYLRNAQVVFIAFDVTSRASFEEVYYWHEIVRRTGPVHQVCYVLAHKIDLTRRRVVGLEEARNAAARLGIRLLETTCQGMGPDLLRAAFYEIAEDFVKRDVLPHYQQVIVPSFSLGAAKGRSGAAASAGHAAASDEDGDDDDDDGLVGGGIDDPARESEPESPSPSFDASFWNIVASVQGPFGAIVPQVAPDTIASRLWKWFNAKARAAAQDLERDRERLVKWMARLGVPAVDPDLISAARLLRVLSSGWAEVQALEIAASAHALGFDRVAQLKRRESLQSRQLRDNELRCPLGCGTILIDRASNIHEHVSDQCRLRQVPCPLGCDEKIRFGDVSDHLKGSCAKRFVECPVCTELVEQGALVPHSERWRLYPRHLWIKADLVHWAAIKVSAAAAQTILESPMAGEGPHVDATRIAALLGCTVEDVQAALPAALGPPPDSSRPAANPMLAGITNFDKRSLKKGSSAASELGAAGGPPAHQGSPLVAGIANFDRSKLKRATAPKTGQKEAAVPAKSMNPLVAGIASFDRSKLRHTEPGDRSDEAGGKSAPPSPSNPSSNPLYSALAQAIERRREAIEGRD